jgi:hypothetical protein
LATDLTRMALAASRRVVRMSATAGPCEERPKANLDAATIGPIVWEDEGGESDLHLLPHPAGAVPL